MIEKINSESNYVNFVFKNVGLIISDNIKNIYSNFKISFNVIHKGGCEIAALYVKNKIEKMKEEVEEIKDALSERIKKTFISSSRPEPTPRITPMLLQGAKYNIIGVTKEWPSS